jgi:hypothetical protein
MDSPAYCPETRLLAFLRYAAPASFESQGWGIGSRDPIAVPGSTGQIFSVRRGGRPHGTLSYVALRGNVRVDPELDHVYYIEIVEILRDSVWCENGLVFRLG